MSLNKDALAFFSPARPAPTAVAAVSTPAALGGSGTISPIDSIQPRGTRVGHRAKRRRREPCDLSVVLASSVRCCRQRCGAKFGDPLVTDFSEPLLRAEHKRFNGLTAEPDRKLFVCNRIPVEYINKHKLFAGNKLVCGTFFKAVFGVSNNVIYAAKQTPGARASSDVGRDRPPRGRQLQHKRNKIIAFVDWYSDLYGQRMPHKPWVVLYTATKKELYERWREFERYTRGDKSMYCSRSYFNRIWKSARPLIKVTSCGDFMKCSECTEVNVKLHGAPGIQPLQDSHQREVVIAQRRAHHQLVSRDREHLALGKQAARREQANGTPLRSVFMEVDAANQSAYALPTIHPHTHEADKGWAERQKVMGCLVEGMFMDVALVPQNTGGGSNLVCTTIWRALHRLHTQHSEPGEKLHIPHLHLQVDNCVGENKNNIVMAFMASLVDAGVVGVAEANFMMVGHTHGEIDQVFSRFSVGTRGRSIFTNSQLAGLFKAAYGELTVHCCTLRNLGNFKDLYFVCNKSNLRKIPNITKFRAFRVEMVAGKVCVRLKDYMHSQHWCGLTTSGVARADAPPHEIFALDTPDFEAMPDFELKKVPGNVIALIGQRNQATLPRLKAAYAMAPEFALDAVLEERRVSLQLLQATGKRTFNLPRHFLHGDDEELSLAELSEPRLVNGGRSELLPEADGEEERGVSSLTAGNPAPMHMTPEAGNIVFFAAQDAPFVLGEVLGISSDDSGTKVRVHWFGPVSQRVRKAVGRMSVKLYASAAFSPDFFRRDGRTGKNPLRADASDEPVSRVITLCERLTKGRKIPARVKRVLLSTSSSLTRLPSETPQGSEESEPDEREEGGDSSEDEEEEAEDEEEEEEEEEEEKKGSESEEDGGEGDSSSGDESSTDRSVRGKFEETARPLTRQRGSSPIQGAVHHHNTRRRGRR